MPPPPEELAARLGIAFRDQRLLAQALVHSSFVNEHPELAAVANERLEFLGDSVLSLIISDALWRAHPEESEGALTTRRAAIVSAAGLARIGDRIDLGRYLVVGQGAERAGERRRASVVASTFEAVVAAVYLDQGLEAARELVLRLAEPDLHAALPPVTFKSAKSRLQERCYAEGGRPPVYRVVAVTGPDHARHYVVEAVVNGHAVGRGEGANRRVAETEAATRALAAIEAVEPGGPAVIPDGAADVEPGAPEPGT